MTISWICRVRVYCVLIIQGFICTPSINLVRRMHCFYPEYWDLMNEDEKHDKIPEIWEGHNIADYIDPDIMKVRSFIDLPKPLERFRCNWQLLVLLLGVSICSFTYVVHKVFACNKTHLLLPWIKVQFGQQIRCAPNYSIFVTLL